MKRSLHIAGVIVSVVVAAPTVWAQDQDDDRHVETVTTLEDARMPSGFSARVKTTDTFEEGGDLARALQFVPGLYIRRQSSFGQPAFVTMRGSNARQVAVSLDGQRISTPFGPGFDLGTFAGAGIESIDVHRGAAAVSRGSGALSGALNLRTGTRTHPGWASTATSIAGSWSTLGLSGGADYATKRMAGRVSGSWRQSGGAFPFEDTQGTELERTNNDVATGSVLGTVTHRFGTNRVKATVNYQQSSRGIAGPAEFQQTFESARLRDQQVFGTLRIDERDAIVSEALAVDLYQSLGAQSRSFDYQNDATVLGGGAFGSNTDFLSLNAAAGALLYWPGLGDVLHIDTEFRGETLVSDKTTTAQRLEADRFTLAGGVSNELLFWHEQASLNAGVRIEALTGSFEDVGVMPAIGLSVGPIDAVQFKTNIARTYRAPDFDELYLDIETLRGNPNLESERAWVWDAGVVLKSGDQGLRGRLEAVYFENRVDALIAFIPVSSYVVEATNLLGVTSRGTELLGTANAGPINVVLGYTFTYSRDQETPNVQTPNQPLHRVLSRIEWQILHHKPGAHALLVSADATAQSQTNLDRFGNITNPAYAMFDAGVSYSPTDWARISVNAYNLGDRRDIVDGLQRPLPGRSFYASLTLKTGSP